jgi:hypothetical protein
MVHFLINYIDFLPILILSLDVCKCGLVNTPTLYPLILIADAINSDDEPLPLLPAT